MNKVFSNNYPTINLYKNPFSKSELISQMIYGESFKIINNYSKWIRIKINEDGYVGYIKKKKIY